MIELQGTHREIIRAVRAVSPTWPSQVIMGLDPGEWFFVLNGVIVRVVIKEGE